MKKFIFYSLILCLFMPQHLWGQWQHLGTNLPAPTSGKLSIWSLAAVDTNTIWALPVNPTAPAPFTGVRLFSRTEDGGNTWISDTVSHDLNYLSFSIFALNADTAWVNMGLLPNLERSKIYRTNNGGSTWTEQTGIFNALGHHVDKIHFFNQNVGIGYGSPGSGTNQDSLRIYRTTNGGTTWTRVHPSQLPAVTGIEVIGTYSGNNNYDVKGDTLWFGTTIGRVWRTTDKGQTWTAYNTGLFGNIASVQFKDPMNGLVVSTDIASGAKTSNGGLSWTIFPTPFPARFAAYIPGTLNSYLMAAVFWPMAQFAITHNGGNNWDSVHYSYPVYLNALQLISPQMGFGGGWVDMPDSGGVYRWTGDFSAPSPGCNTCLQPINVFPDKEGFEGNGGNWCQAGNDDLDWTLVNGPTISVGTGPTSAFEGNYYLYLEASSPNFPNKAASLVSPCYELDTACIGMAQFTFSYHMLGTDMGQLAISVSTDSGQSWQNPIWAVSGNQGGNWHTDSIDLSAFIGQTIRLQVRGSIMLGFSSDFALDNLVMRTTPLMQVNPTLSHIDCHGNATGQVVPGLMGGLPPYTYSWSNGASTPSIQNLPAGSYQVMVSDSNGCAITQTFTLSEPPLLVTTLTQVGIRCNGMATGSATVLASGGTGTHYSYLWSTADTTASINDLPPGTFSVITTDMNGCMALDTVTITQPAALVSNLTVVDVDCFGDTNGAASLNPTGGTGAYSYIWSSGSNTDSISNLAPGTYSYLVSDALNCITSGTFMVNEPSEIDPSLQPTDISCFGLTDGMVSATPTGGNGGFTYTWSNGDTTAANLGLGAGTYAVTVTDSKGCVGSDSAHIQEPPQLTATTTSTNLSCFGVPDGTAMAIATGGSDSLTYSWTGGLTGPSLTALGAGTYQLIVTDANGCTFEDSLIVTEPPELISNGVVTDASMPGVANGSIDLTLTGGTPPYASITWSTGATTEDLDSLLAGTYTVKIVDANGCIRNDTFVVGTMVGISDALALPGFGLYPNPAESELFVSYTLSTSGPVIIESFDVTGKKVLAIDGPGLPGPHTIRLNIGNLSPGVYVLMIETGQGKGIAKWTKMR